MSAAVKHKRIPEDVRILRGTALHETGEQIRSWQEWIDEEIVAIERARREKRLP